MGRQPFGADKVMAAVLACEQEAGGPGKEIKNPIRTIRGQILKSGDSLSELTLRKYLNDLENAGCVRFTEGGFNGREFVGLTVLKSDLPASHFIFRAKKEAKEDLEKSRPESVPEPKRPVVAMLVDYDNTKLAARDAGFSISFFKLREHARSFGDLWLSDVFLSPFASRDSNIIEQMSAAGYQAIVCPRGSKEKDAVDSKMNWRARQYIEIPGVDVVVIVSRDTDFNDLAVFAADRHKKVIYIDVVTEKVIVRGVDQEVEVAHSREYEAFHSAYKFLQNGMSPSDAETIKRFEFLKDIISSLRDQVKPQSFKGIQSEVEFKIKEKWEDQFAGESLRHALTVLVDANLILKMIGDGVVQY
ncbi:MAG: hypothetical protein G01um101419_558, partial [Parcubacteria group bacterium Gr01-1014_19]